jgi:outer membrane protein insertion porin family
MKRFAGWMRPPPFAIWVASICAMAVPIITRAQAPEAAPGPPIVRSIDVQYTGPATLSKERILAQIRTRVGQPYSNQVVEDDIQALYKTGFIRNVRIFAQPEGNGVKVIVAVQTRGIVREIEIVGADRIKPKRLRKEIKLKLNQAVDEQALEEARQKIIDVYQGRGFTDVNVQYRVDPIDEKRGSARVVFTVTEGVRGAVSQVNFEGNTHFSAKVLRKQMKTRGRSFIYFVDKTGRFDEVQLEQDLDKLREYYQDHGYIDVEIKTPRRERTEKGPMIITIPIVEGPQYHVH